MNFANNKKFGHSQLGAHLLDPSIFAEILTKHLQLHLFCPSNNQFEIDIRRAFEPSGLVWSLEFLYP